MPMKTAHVIFVLLYFLLIRSLLAQNKEEAEKLIAEGIAYHDRGDYEGAAAKYDKALLLDKDNLLALYEKAYSYVASQKYDEAISICKNAIEKHSGADKLKYVFVTYGNALDGLKKTDLAIEKYNEGIKLFPDENMLYYNKGITLVNIRKYDESIGCFQKSLKLAPDHASSHNALATILSHSSERIPAILALSRFLMIESKGPRAQENLRIILALSSANVETQGKSGGTKTMVTASQLQKTQEFSENNFASIDLALSMLTVSDFSKKNKRKSEVELFQNKMESLFSIISDLKKDNFGFYWEYYAPYFIEMKDKNFIETFSFIAFAPKNDPKVLDWLQSHPNELKNFFIWSDSYKWPKD